MTNMQEDTNKVVIKVIGVRGRRPYRLLRLP